MRRLGNNTQLWVTCFILLVLVPCGWINADPMQVFPSAKWGWYLTYRGTEDWRDSNGNLIMSKDDITRWIVNHGDWLLSGPVSGYDSDVIRATKPGIPLDMYREWHYVNVFDGDDHFCPTTYLGADYPSRLMYIEGRLSQGGRDPEDMYLHVGQDTYWSGQRYRLFVDMWGLIFFWTSSDKFWRDREKMYRGDTSTTLNVPSSSSGYVAFGCIYPTDEIQLEFNVPNNGGQFVLEYSTEINPLTCEITGWQQVPVIEDTTNGFTQDGRIRWHPRLSGWVRGRLPGTTVSEYRSACYFVRIRCISAPVQTMNIKGVRTSSWLQYYPSILASGQSIYIGSRTTFTSATLTLLAAGAGGSYVVEYPTSKGSNEYATGWTTLSNVSDGSMGLTQNGTISWDLPANWEPAHLSLSFAPKLYWIRIRATASPSVSPVLREATVGGVAVSNQHLYGDRYTIRIPGWSSSNDTNGDGWIDDSEYANLQNPNCHARTRYQSRAARFGWLNTTTFEINWGLQGLKEIVADYYYELALASPNATGLYSDSQTYGGCPYPTIEYPDPSQRLWVRDWNRAFSHIRTTGKRVGGNTSAHLVYAPKMDDSWHAGTGWFTKQYNDFLNREGFLHGFNDANAWWNGIILDTELAFGDGLIQLFQSNFSSALASRLNATSNAIGWKRFQEHSVALYYLLQHPELGYLNISHGYSYGASVVDTPIGRMPKPIAHQPTALLSVDIGVPTNAIPEGYQPVTLTYTPLWGSPTYTVGDTSSAWVNSDVPYIGGKPLYPTYMFVLGQGINPNTGRSYAVYARKFTRGLVVVKMMGSSYDAADVSDASLTIHALPGTYRRVNWDGTLGPPVTEIALRGMEGAILVDTESVQRDIQVTLTVTSPQGTTQIPAGEEVTAILTVVNTGTYQVNNIIVQHPIPPTAEYVSGSLRLNGVTLNDPPVPVTRIEVMIPFLGSRGTAIVEFRIRIR